MTRQVHLRVVLVVDDGVQVGELAAMLKAEFRGRGNVDLLAPDGQASALGDRTIFFAATDVRRGPETVERKNKKGAPA